MGCMVVVSGITMELERIYLRLDDNSTDRVSEAEGREEVMGDRQCSDTLLT